MEINVWNRRFVLAVAIGLSLSTSSTAIQKLENPGLSPNVPVSVVDSTSTLPTGLESQEKVLRITRRTKAVGESRFGSMAYEGTTLCYTLEHESVKIPAGTYRGELRWSERFQKTVPYIHVPRRAGIEVHTGNCPSESGGCVLIGTEVHGACLRNSRRAFGRMMKVLPQTFTVIVTEN